MRFRRPATPVQRLMVTFMAVALGALLLWLIPELLGAFSAELEDTYSEWVWDQSLWLVITITVVHVLVGVAAIGSAWHFIEGWGRRRRLEKRTRDLQGGQ